MVRGLVPPPILMYLAPVGANAVRIAAHATLVCDPRPAAVRALVRYMLRNHG
jgi:hypothetical protein